jgi:hypothetical protein
METNKIHLLRQERHETAILNSNRFEFNSKGRLLWLQKLLFKVLRWLKADSYDTAIEYTTVEIDPSNIIDALMRNRVDVERLYNKRARYVVMGPRDFQRFSSAPEINSMLMFSFSTPIGMNGKQTILGLEVVIVPWIDGFFVLPDLESEHKIALSA